MTQKKVVNLAFDFGASSGRLMMGHYNEGKISLEEVHRFPNEPVYLGTRYFWDFLRLFHEMKAGLKKVAALNVEVASIGVDTWGVDYGLLNEQDELIGNPVHYRDSRTEGILEEIEEKAPYAEIYRTTGIQYMPFNTLYQLYHDTYYRKSIIEKAHSLLFIPDLFNFFLTGNKYNEYTIASTSQMLEAQTRSWSNSLLEKFNIPMNLLQPIIQPGEVYGYLQPSLCKEVGLEGKIPVVAIGSHDTASAVAGTPLGSKTEAYLSCGTWSLLGLELREPIINDTTLKYNFTNEGGVEGTIRFLKNINGLWLIQQLKQNWNHLDIDYPEISRAAAEAERNHFIIDTNAEGFLAPFNMAEEIQNYCREKNQGTPETVGEIARAAYNGLAQQYKQTIEQLEEIIAAPIETLHMVGGGIQDTFLCQHTANIVDRRVLAGPIESSVLGNIILQLMAIGTIKSLEEGRQLIAQSFKMKEYIPSK